MTNVDYQVEDCVGMIRLNRPEKLNAFTFEMIAEIRKAADTAAADEHVVGIVVTGAGRAFVQDSTLEILRVGVGHGAEAEPASNLSDEDCPHCSATCCEFRNL